MKKKTKAKRVAVTGKSDAANVQLRDYFAAMALSGIVGDASNRTAWLIENGGTMTDQTRAKFYACIAQATYEQADAMLSAREAKP